MKTGRGDALIWLFLLAAGGCGSPASSPVTPLLAPTPAVTPTPPPPAYLYALKRHGDGAGTLYTYRVEAASGRLEALGGVRVADAASLAAMPEGTLVVSRCRQLKDCWVETLRPDAQGRPALADESEALSANIRSVATAGSFAIARWDDSSTGYSAGLAAYHVEAATGALGPAQFFAGRGGCYSCVRWLNAFEVSHDGSRVFVAEGDAHLAVYGMDASGPGSRLGEDRGFFGKPLQITSHPQGAAAYMLSQDGETHYLTSYALDSEGVPSYRGSQALGLRDPHSLALDPTGRHLYVSGRWSIDLFEVDPVTRLPEFSSVTPVEQGRGRLAVEPEGRFLYLAREDGSGVAAFTVDPATGALAELGPQGPGDSDLVIHSGPPTTATGLSVPGDGPEPTVP